jgi:uncharacterized membrane protein
MEWVIFALIGPAFWTISNFIDKYAIEKITKGIADYAFWGSIGPICIITFLPLFFDIHTPVTAVLLTTLVGGFLLNYTYMTYGITLSHADTSRVIPIFQIKSVLILLVGFLFLGEILSTKQFLGFAVAMIGVLLLSLDLKNIRVPKFNKWTLLALISTCAFATITLMNDFSVENLDVPSFIFYFDIGFLSASISYLFFPKWRNQIIEGLKTATWKKVGLFVINDAADEMGQFCSKMALVTAPAAALVSVVNGIHSFYVLLGGIILTIWFPLVTKEDISIKMLAQKFLGAGIIFFGIAILYLF